VVRRRVSQKGQDLRIVDQLNREWAELLPVTLGEVAAWAAASAQFGACRSLDDVLAAIRICPDSALGELINLGAAGDDLTYRTVLQSMLGKVVRLALADPNSSVGDYVTSMWLHIKTYPLQARPRRIAANLALDTLKTVKGEARRHAGRQVAMPPEAIADLAEGSRGAGEAADEGPDWSAAVVIGRAQRLSLIDDLTRNVLMTVYAEGLPGKQAAERHQTTPEMVRYRCSRAVRKMTEHRDLLAA
jgi:DNA-directed RNA polymerase specialized sigma24 family protein